MTEGKGRNRPSGRNKAPREVERPSAAPGPTELGNSAVEEDDISAEDELQTETIGTCEPDDPWAEHMKDLARLVLAAYEIDPHRFDEIGK
jgi:hypothetical protein